MFWAVFVCPPHVVVCPATVLFRLHLRFVLSCTLVLFACTNVCSLALGVRVLNLMVCFLTCMVLFLLHCCFSCVGLCFSCTCLLLSRTWFLKRKVTQRLSQTLSRNRAKPWVFTGLVSGASGSLARTTLPWLLQSGPGGGRAGRTSTAPRCNRTFNSPLIERRSRGCSRALGFSVYDLVALAEIRGTSGGAVKKKYPMVPIQGLMEQWPAAVAAAAAALLPAPAATPPAGWHLARAHSHTLAHATRTTS